MSERAALEGARHPCIVELVATYADKQQLYLLMEISLGGELFALLSQVGVIAEAQARYYAASLTLALGHLHSMGYMYRDVKPENLLFADTAKRTIKLCDFGCARRLRRRPRAPHRAARHTTATPDLTPDASTPTLTRPTHPPTGLPSTAPTAG